MIAMHAGKGPYTLRTGEHGGRYKTYFITLKPVLTFQTYERVFLEQELLFQDFAAWIDLTSNTDSTITVYELLSKNFSEHILIL